MGQKIPDDCGQLEAALGRGDPLLRLSAADPQDDLHDQRDREFAHAIKEGIKMPRAFSE